MPYTLCLVLRSDIIIGAPILLATFEPTKLWSGLGVGSGLGLGLGVGVGLGLGLGLGVGVGVGLGVGLVVGLDHPSPHYTACLTYAHRANVGDRFAHARHDVREELVDLRIDLARPFRIDAGDVHHG